MLKPIVCLLFLAAVQFAPGSAFAQRVTTIDRIVAVVNNEVITASELRVAMDSARRQLERQKTPIPEQAALERQVLDGLILRRSQLQLAARTGLKVDDTQLDRAVERIAESNKMSLDQFKRVLEKDGVAFEAFRNDVREQILLRRIREREVDDKIQISESEIDLFLERAGTQGGERSERNERVEYNVAHILLPLPEGARPEVIERTRARAEELRGEAAGGADFAKLAASFSGDQNALRGGALGWRTADRLPELFATALAKMNRGEVSPVLRSPAGFHILKLVDLRGAGPAAGPAPAPAATSGAPVPQARVRHILIRTGENVSEDEAQRRLNDLRERVLRGNDDFAELARLHSQDGSASRGGDLGWVHPGDTVAPFERAMAALEPNQISPPVKTPFGWHLIQVLERRTAPVTTDRLRQQARVTLRERKSEEAFQEWLRQLRDETYVELRTDER